MSTCLVIPQLSEILVIRYPYIFADLHEKAWMGRVTRSIHKATSAVPGRSAINPCVVARDEFYCNAVSEACLLPHQL